MLVWKVVIVYQTRYYVFHILLIKKSNGEWNTLASLYLNLLTKPLLTTTTCITFLLLQLILGAFCWISGWLIRHIVVLGDELKVIKGFETTNQEVLFSSHNRDLNGSSIIGTINSRNAIDPVIKKWGFRIIGHKIKVLVPWSDISNSNGFRTISLKVDIVWID